MAFDHGDLDQDTADRLLAGRLTPDDAPPGYGGVAQLLQRAHVDPGLDVTDDELVVAMVNAIVTSDPAPKERNHVLTRIVTTKVLMATAVVALTATGAAAATGSLPDEAQNGLAHAAQHVGINLPEAASDKAREKSDHPHANAGTTTRATEATETDEDANGAGDHGNATTPRDPAAATPDASTPTTANHGAVVSQTAHVADPSGGKGDEVSPVARDNHGAEVRAENQTPPTTTAGGPGNSNGHANPNSDNASDNTNAKP